MQITKVLAILNRETELGKDLPIGEMFLACKDPAMFRSQAEMITTAWRIGLEALHDRIVWALAQEENRGDEDGREGEEEEA